jgi:hypothetical protein
MEIADIVLLVLASLAAGAVNSVAGGGTFFTFPVLIMAGVPPVVANATSTIAVWPGAVASAWAYRHQVKLNAKSTLLLALVSLVGGGAGAAILLVTPEAAFEFLIPWLMLSATVLFAASPKIRNWVMRRKSASDIFVVSGLFLFLQFMVALYGGYFGAGIGILMLAVLACAGMSQIHEMNGLKTVLGSCINGVAVVIFIFSGIVDWYAAGIMVVAAIAGGYLGAVYAQKLSQKRVRFVVIATGALMTGWFFVNG